MRKPTIAEKMFLLLLLITAGCVFAKNPPSAVPNYPGQNIIIETASKLDWLTIIGVGTIAFGVCAFLNGNSSGISIIAAGITVVACSIIITATLAALTEYRKFFIIALSFLGIAGFFIFGKTAADANSDGKINWQDIKFIFTKLKRKTPPPNAG